jgi:hypothetical protein
MCATERLQSFLKTSLRIELDSRTFILSHSANRFLLHLGMRSVRLTAQLDSWCLRSQETPAATHICDELPRLI